MGLGLVSQFFGKYFTPDEARRLIGAGRRDRHRRRAEPRGEGHLADRPAAVRGVRQGLHRQAVADRPQGTAGEQHHPAAGALHVQQPLLQRHLRGPAGRRVHRVAEEHGRRRPHRGAAGHRLVRRARPLRAEKPDAPWSTPVRWIATSTTPRPTRLAHTGFRGRGAAHRRLPGHPGDELQRPRRGLHPDPRVQALPSRAGIPDRQDGDHAGVLALRR